MDYESDVARGIKSAREFGLGRNVLLAQSAGVKRIGYRGFLSAVWALFKMNRAARSYGVKVRLQVDLPIRWLR